MQLLLSLSLMMHSFHPMYQWQDITQLEYSQEIEFKKVNTSIKVYVNVKCKCTCPDVPVSSEDCTIYTPGIGALFYSFISSVRIQHLHILLQPVIRIWLLFLIPPATHHCLRKRQYGMRSLHNRIEASHSGLMRQFDLYAIITQPISRVFVAACLAIHLKPMAGRPGLPFF